jgi:hypothetical protein
MGDDHCVRTPGWDRKVTQTLAEMGTGICYGDDLFQGERLPTAVLMTANIVQTLGYMAPPQFQHQWVDNVWRDWGLGINRLRYLPDVVIEHLHPVCGKAEPDGSYRDTIRLLDADGQRYREYRRLGLADDIRKLAGLL